MSLWKITTYISFRYVLNFLALLVQERSYKDSVGQRHSAGEYEAVYTCTVCEIGLFTEEEDDVEQIGVLAMLRNTEGRWNRFGRSGGCRTNNKQLRTRVPASALFCTLRAYELVRNLLPPPGRGRSQVHASSAAYYWSGSRPCCVSL